MPSAIQGVFNLGDPPVGCNLCTDNRALHEWPGLRYYRLTGRTRELFPAP